MGARGPVPSRDSELARQRSRNGRGQPGTSKAESIPASIPEPDENWHPIATQLYLACTQSGQRVFYQESDWALLFSICEDLSFYKKSGKRSGQMLASIYSAMSSLLVTEGDRRRVRIELDRPEEMPVLASVSQIAGYEVDLGLA